MHKILPLIYIMIFHFWVISGHTVITGHSYADYYVVWFHACSMQLYSKKKNPQKIGWAYKSAILGGHH